MIYFEKRGERIVRSFSKMVGREYLSDKKAEEYARDNLIGALKDFDGNVIMKSVWFPEEAETKLVGEQVIREAEVGSAMEPHVGKTLSEVPELMKTVLNPATYEDGAQEPEPEPEPEPAPAE